MTLNVWLNSSTFKTLLRIRVYKIRITSKVTHAFIELYQKMVRNFGTICKNNYKA